jgi:hypothetical protein
MRACRLNSSALIKTFVHSLTHGAEPFLRSRQLCTHARTSQNFIEPEGWLPRSHKSPPLLLTISHINSIHIIQSYLSEIHFHIVQLPTSWSSQWSLSFWFCNQCPICIPLLPHSCYMPYPSHPPCKMLSNYEFFKRFSESRRTGEKESLCWRGPAAIYWTGLKLDNNYGATNQASIEKNRPVPFLIACSSRRE